MNEDLGVLEGGEELPAHFIRDHSVLQSKHMQGGHLDGGAVKPLVFRTRAAETSHDDGKAKAEIWLRFLLLERAQHGDEGGPLTEAQDAVKRTLVLHSSSHSCHALVEPQALLALPLSVETPSLDIRKPPTPGVVVPSRLRSCIVLFICNF